MTSNIIHLQHLGAPSEQEDSDKEIMEKLQAQIDAEKEKNKQGDAGLFQVRI